MIFITNPTKNAIDNFAIENWLAQTSKFNDLVFMLWSTTPTIMLGKYQNVINEINLKEVKRKNINLVRRLSGGGTIYTDENTLEYSFIIPKSLTNDDLNVNLKKYTSDIVSILNLIDNNIQQTGRNDVVYNNKKIVGSAQYTYNKHIIHHGSIIFNVDIKLVNSLLKTNVVKNNYHTINSKHSEITNLSKVTNLNSIKELEFKLKNGIFKKYKNVLMYKLNKVDLTEIYKIKFFISKNNKIISLNDFDHKTYKREKYIENVGLIQISFNILNNKIQDFSLNGSFFANFSLNYISDNLNGLNYDFLTVLNKIKSLNLSYFFTKLSPLVLTQIIFDKN